MTNTVTNYSYSPQYAKKLISCSTMKCCFGRLARFGRPSGSRHCWGQSKSPQVHYWAICSDGQNLQILLCFFRIGSFSQRISESIITSQSFSHHPFHMTNFYYSDRLPKVSQWYYLSNYWRLSDYFAFQMNYYFNHFFAGIKPHYFDFTVFCGQKTVNWPCHILYQSLISTILPQHFAII